MSSSRACRSEVVVLALAGEARELREQRGLHRLEQQQRDAGDEQAGDELPAVILLGRTFARSWHAEDAGVGEQLGEQRAEQQPAERARQLRVRRARDRGSGGRAGRAARSPPRSAAAARARGRTSRPRSTRRPPRGRCRRGCATLPSEPCIKPYGPKRPLPDERAPRHVRDVVTDDRDEQADQQPVCPWNSSSTIGCGRDRASQRHDRGEDAAEDGGPLHEGAAADARATRRCATARADLLLERLEQSGRDDEHDRPEARSARRSRCSTAAWRR